jgi:hypothetical protein
MRMTKCLYCGRIVIQYYAVIVPAAARLAEPPLHRDGARCTFWASRPLTRRGRDATRP